MTLATAPSHAGQIRDNYPAHALLAHEQGTVAVTVTVGFDGRVKDCVVTMSSGYKNLDEAACDSFRKYARFDPAKDDKGNPIEKSYSTHITYKLPG